MKIDLSNESSKGQVTYSRGIINSIIMLAAEEVEGVAFHRHGTSKNAKTRPQIRVEFCKDNQRDAVVVDVGVRIKQEYKVPDVAFNIQENITHVVENCTNFKVLSVNVNVLDVEFSEEVRPELSEPPAAT